MSPTRELFHQRAHLYLLVLTAFAIPLSVYLMSVAGLLLAINWLVRRNPLDGFKRFFADKAAVVFTLLYLIHVAGFFYSSDTATALNDLRIKLPLLLFPIVLSSTEPIGRKGWLLVLKAFVAAVLISAGSSFLIYFGLTETEVNNFRDLSPFISHIRMSLCLCLAIALLFISILRPGRWFWRIIAGFVVLCLVYLLNLLQSATGFVILMCLLVMGLYKLLQKIRSLAIRLAILVVIVLLPAAYVGYHAKIYFWGKDPFDKTTALTRSMNGEPYRNDWNVTLTENGHYVFMYIAEQELEREWNKRSRLPLDSVGADGYSPESRVFRYMASLGLTKDSVGVRKLTDEDIRAIERGEVNYNYREKIPGIQRRLYDIFLEIDSYLNGGVNGSSVIQRMVYFKTGLSLARKNLLTGVGTGDLQQAFNREYETSASPLEEKYRLRAHNQYLTMLIAFGIPGLLIFLAAIFYPPFAKNTWKSLFFRMFMIVALISFVAEDTLETQAGVTFFTFFFALSVWGIAPKNAYFASKSEAWPRSAQ